MSELRRSLGLLVSRLVHDMKNPLAVVMSNLRYLEAAVHEPDDREALEESLVAASRLDRMLDNAVDLGRLASDALTSERTTVDLAELGQTLAADLALLAGHRTLTWALADGRLVTDHGLLRRLLLNVLEHALRHTPGRGKVQVVGEAEGGGYALRIIDGGAPFAPAVPASFVEEGLPVKEDPPAGHRSDQGLGLYFSGVAARALGARTGVRPRDDGEPGVVFELVFGKEHIA